MMKKLLSVCMSILLAAALLVPAFAADTATGDLPLLYIAGRGFELVRPDGVRVWKTEGNAFGNVSTELKNLLKDYVSGVFKRDFSAFNDRLYDCIAPVYADASLGRDGFPTDGSGVPDDVNWRLGLDRIASTVMTSGGNVPAYRWQYDWRLSPIVLADELHELIDAVLASTGAPQVNIISRCEGSTIAYAYLYKYSAENKVHACVMNADITEGSDFLTALFTGDIRIERAALCSFLQFFLENGSVDAGSDALTDLLSELVAFGGSVGSLHLLTKVAEGIVKSVRNELLPRILQSSFATYPAYWSMLTADKYEQAKAFVFGSDVQPWRDLIAQTDAFWAMQKDCRAFLQQVSKSVRICVIAKYGLPAIPLSDNAAQESDLFLAVPSAAHGAAAADYDGMLPNAYIRAQTDAGLGRYISPDRKIDASTCALPDTTWFVKGVAHRCFPACVEDLTVAFVRSDGMTVSSNEAFPQFLQFRATQGDLNDAQGFLTAVDAADVPSALSENRFVRTVTNPFVRFVSLTRAFWRFVFSRVRT